MKSFAVGTWETEGGRCGERKSLGEFFSGGGGREGEVHMMRATRGRARTVVIFLKLYCMVVILKEVRAANAVSFQMGRSDDRLARRVSEVQM
jgi:hypothetical protein